MSVDCPSPPSDRPKVSKVTPTSCHLDWDPPADDGGSPVTSYVVERLTDGGAEGEDAAQSWHLVGRSYVRHMIIWDLIAGRQYQFRVSAENVYGKSVAGDESEAIIASGSADHDASAEMDYDSLGLYLFLYFYIYISL